MYVCMYSPIFLCNIHTYIHTQMAQTCVELGEGGQSEKILSDTRRALSAKIYIPHAAAGSPSSSSLPSRTKTVAASGLLAPSSSSSSKPGASVINLEALEAWVECSLMLARLLVGRFVQTLQEGEAAADNSTADGR